MEDKYELLEEHSGRYVLTITAEQVQNNDEESPDWKITCELTHMITSLRIHQYRTYKDLNRENVREVFDLLSSTLVVRFKYAKREYGHAIVPLVNNTRSKIDSCALSFPVLEEGDDPPED
jgi:hypothetical protein